MCLLDHLGGLEREGGLVRSDYRKGMYGNTLKGRERARRKKSELSGFQKGKYGSFREVVLKK